MVYNMYITCLYKLNCSIYYIYILYVSIYTYIEKYTYHLHIIYDHIIIIYIYMDRLTKYYVYTYFISFNIRHILHLFNNLYNILLYIFRITNVDYN